MDSLAVFVYLGSPFTTLLMQANAFNSARVV